jgi:hypothetical protein
MAPVIDIDRLYSKWVRSMGEERINLKYPSLRGLYDWFLRECERLGIDPETIDFEMIVDPSLSYHENKTLLSEMMAAAPSEKEFENMYEEMKEHMEKQVREKYPEIVEEWMNRIAELEKEARAAERLRQLNKELRFKLEETERRLEQERKAREALIKPMKIRILRDFEEGIMKYKAGQLLEVSDREWVSAKIREGLAEEVPPEVPVAPPPKPIMTPEEIEETRREYRRRFEVDVRGLGLPIRESLLRFDDLFTGWKIDVEMLAYPNKGAAIEALEKEIKSLLEELRVKPPVVPPVAVPPAPPYVVPITPPAVEIRMVPRAKPFSDEDWKEIQDMLKEGIPLKEIYRAMRKKYIDRGEYFPELPEWYKE